MNTASNLNPRRQRRTCGLAFLLAALLGCGGSNEAPPEPDAAAVPQSSGQLLIAMFRLLAADDEAGFLALGLADAPDFDALCPDPKLGRSRTEIRDELQTGYRECHDTVAWPTVRQGFPRIPLHPGLNRSERRCGDVDGCPGLERLCKSELFGYVPNGSDKVKISLHGAYRRKADRTLLIGRAPRCYARPPEDAP